MSENKHLRLSVLLCNSITHYDTTIYILLVPILAPIFFDNTLPLFAIIKGYLTALIGILVRPLGVIYFANLANKKGPLCALSRAIIGISCATLSMILIPSKTTLAPIALLLIRALQAFFAAGESNLAKLYFIKKDATSHNLSSITQYEASSLAGMTIASLSAYICSRYPNFWRLAFFLPCLGMLFALVMRFNTTKTSVCVPQINQTNQISITTFWTFVTNNKGILFKISLLHGFNYFTYSFAFVFINICVPIINSSVNYEAMLALNTPFLALDALVLLTLYNKKFVKSVAKIAPILPALLSVLICGVFFQTNNAQAYLYANILRACVIIIGVICAVSFTEISFHASLQISNNRYLVCGICYCLGSDLLGRSLPALGLLLMQNTTNHWPIIFFCSCICLASSFCALSLQKLDHKK